MGYYIEHLSKDKKLKKLIKHHGHFKLKKQKNLCLYLCYSIISQQLSTKVASVIQQRFLNLYDDLPTPQQIIDTPFEKLRGVGMSNAKANYVQNVARFEMESGMHHTKLHKMSNDEVIEYLTQIKGVGRWTTEMLLMFALCREDVFAIDDLGIRNAMLNQPVEVSRLRPQFATAMGIGGGGGSSRPDLVVRFGRGPEMPKSLRRDLRAVLV